jgi:hypothetical protein
MPETLAAFVKRTGMAKAPQDAQVDAWYQDAYGPEPDINKDAYVQSMRKHYERVDPVFEPPFNLIRSLQELSLEPYYIRKPRDFLLRFENDDFEEEDDVEFAPINKHLLDRERRRVSVRAPYDTPLDYMGVPPESIGDTKREKNYWIGKVYLHNMHINGERRSGVLSEDLAKYFGVNESTIRRAARYADAVVTIPPVKTKLGAATRENKLTGDWGLKNLVIQRWIPMWKQCDGADNAYDAKELALRKCPK